MSQNNRLEDQDAKEVEKRVANKQATKSYAMQVLSDFVRAKRSGELDKLPADVRSERRADDMKVCRILAEKEYNLTIWRTIESMVSSDTEKNEAFSFLKLFICDRLSGGFDKLPEKEQKEMLEKKDKYKKVLAKDELNAVTGLAIDLVGEKKAQETVDKLKKKGRTK